MRCENNFIENTSRDKTGRYTVALPFGDNKELLGDSLKNALSLFQRLELRFDRDENLRNGYSNFMSEYETLGHMKRVGNLNEIIDHRVEKPEYYIPHHPVFKTSSSTTKLRVVFNASSPRTTDLSLNNILLVGPTIQSGLFSILIRFRNHNVALIGDIEKIFRQVNVIKQHRDLQRILWRNNKNDPITI
ncbi:hypothetical protein Trydic_g18525 [Trypoxylus dichotomus]